MATNLRRIEKEFILGSARDDKLTFLLLAGSGEWPCKLAAIAPEGLTFSHAMPVRLLKRSQVYEFRFIYREQPMAFRARVLEARDSSVVTEMPEAVYKNLGRRYSRRAPPSELTVSFSFKGDRYELSFPVTREFEPVVEPESDSDFDPHDIRVLVNEFNERASEYASERAIRMFKERHPETLEERLIVRTGKIYFLPTAAGGLPVVDPYVNPRIVTRDIFAEFLRSEDVREDLVGDEVLRFERNKKNSSVLSELAIPLLFQEYVIGYIRAGLPDLHIPAVSQTCVHGVAHIPRDKPTHITRQFSKRLLVTSEPLRHLLDPQLSATRSHLDIEGCRPDIVEFEEPLLLAKRRLYNVRETRRGPGSVASRREQG